MAVDSSLSIRIAPVNGWCVGAADGRLEAGTLAGLVPEDWTDRRRRSPDETTEAGADGDG